MTSPRKGERQAGGTCYCGPPLCAKPACKLSNCGPPPCDKPGRLVNLREEDNLPCSPKNCIIFGGLDAPYHPPFDPKMCFQHGRGRIDNSLGDPFGTVWLFQAQKANVPNQETIRYATYLKGFALAFITPRNDWTSELLNKLLQEGLQLYNDSQNLENPNAVLNPDVYNENEQKVTRYFKLDGYDFMVELEPPFELDERPNTIGNLRRVLKAFFRKAQFGLFWTTNWYLLLWRDKGIYFVLDFNGRSVEEYKSNQDGGFPVLMILKSVDNMAYLIKALSGLEPGDKFTLREMVVTKLGFPDGPVIERDFGQRMSQYEVIASDYAYLKSNLHLTLNPKDALRNRSALPVAIATMVASKIDHPATWDQRMYDKVMCYGVNMCKNCWEPCWDLTHPLDLDTFPRQLRMGQFVAEILLTPNAYEGNWRCVPNYRDNDFHHILEKALAVNDYVLFQINNQMYATWKKNDFIYLMDPYRHHIVGRILEEGEDPKSASIRMFSNFDKYLSVFHQILLESNRSARFHIHTLQIRNITECPPGMAPPLLPADEEVEVESLNENINFDENYQKCLDELGEISDYEEDLQSEIEPIIELSSSEEMVEEEEGGEGEAMGGGEEEIED